MIRKGTAEDFEQIIPLCEAFWRETEFDIPFDPDESFRRLEISLESDILAVAEVDKKIVGFGSGIVVPMIGNANYFLGVEQAWYVLPEFQGKRIGLLLFDFLENLAKEAGVYIWSMVLLKTSNPKVKEFYRKKGYSKSEEVWTKVL